MGCEFRILKAGSAVFCAIATTLTVPHEVSCVGQLRADLDRDVDLLQHRGQPRPVLGMTSGKDPTRHQNSD